jgi:hypothetical protein
MTYRIEQTSGPYGHYWYFDILNIQGFDIHARAWFETEDEAMFAARAELFRLEHQRKAA